MYMIKQHSKLLLSLTVLGLFLSVRYKYDIAFFISLTLYIMVNWVTVENKKDFMIKQIMRIAFFAVLLNLLNYLSII